eukprot:gnl/MRDRNA2_/MRDRNA2_92517_c0_seq1.p1 gnl/MRDRNA2_/MRDRNA2_92517_c0~~gnl/MRDRNA2_/MRDRNA2_92517_c0_seq1.p1  ORF type:complete len:238 (-),score=62.49 gnl/MRDRNA2_/MRDRNA2_92517_c0_seq1:64-777(-)
MMCLRVTVLLSLSSVSVHAFDAAMRQKIPSKESCTTNSAGDVSCKAERVDLEQAIADMPLEQGVILLQQAVKHRSGDSGNEELETILAEMSNVVSNRGHATTAAPEPATATGAPPASPKEASPATPAVSAAGDGFARIAPFGKEDTAQELQHHAARTQDTLVDAVENAEVAEIKRAVFRALTRLRAASIKEFDTIARLETQAIDEYNDAHHYRAENPLSYLHADEPQVTEDKFTSFH